MEVLSGSRPTVVELVETQAAAAAESCILTGGPGSVDRPAYTIVRAEGSDLASYHRLRTAVFVHEQGLFEAHDLDDLDSDPRTVVLLARTPGGDVLGGVRIHPAQALDGGRDIGWWQGSRLAVAPAARSGMGVGAALVRAACARAEDAGALRFEATVQARNAPLFARLGWVERAPLELHGQPHLLMDYPIARIQRLAQTTKSALGELLGGLLGAFGQGSEQPHALGGPGFVGDDGAPVPGSDLVAACDAILPSMVERDPEWAGWCAALVNLNDLSAMGASPVGLLDAVGARDASFARRILRGLGEASRAWGVPVLGGHTQLGVPGSLAVTALGRTSQPVPGGGGRPGEAVRVTADLAGRWRPGYTGTQWDSSSHRTTEELRAVAGVVPALRPSAAKDVSMSGLVGTAGMLAEASGCRAVLDVAAVPAPTQAGTADWLTCFPGFAMVTTEREPASSAPPGFLASAVCGVLETGSGVGLRWPDQVVTEAVPAGVTGIGAA